MTSEDGAEEVDPAAAPEEDTSFSALRCSFCTYITLPTVSQQSLPTIHDTSSEDVQSWLQLRLPAATAASGHGTNKVDPTVDQTLHDIVRSEVSGSRVVKCKRCHLLFRHLRGRTKADRMEQKQSVISFWRRRSRPTSAKICFLCEKENAHLGRNNVLHGVDVGFDYRLSGTAFNLKFHRSITELVSHRLGLPVESVTDFFLQPSKYRLCNRHKQNNRHAMEKLRQESSTCAISTCGAVLGLQYLRAPPDGDCSAMEDAMDAVFEGSEEIESVLDRRVCEEHLALISMSTPTNSELAAKDGLRAIHNRYDSATCAFIISLLVAFGEELHGPPSTSRPLVPAALPLPVSGVIWYKDIYNCFERYWKANSSAVARDHNVPDRRTLRHTLCLSLAPFGIHAEKDPKSGYIYYFRQACVEKEARGIQGYRVEPLESPNAPSQVSTPACIRTLTSDYERSELNRIAHIFRDNKENYMNGSYEARDIATVPSTEFWVYLSWTFASTQLKKGWKRRVRVNNLNDVTDVFCCGNKEKSMPAGNILNHLSPSEVRHFRRVLTNIEHRVYASTGVPGPVLIGTGALVSLKGTKSLQTFLYRLGSSISYSETLRMKQYWKRRRDSHSAHAFAGIPKKSFVNLALDNLDISLSHQVNVAGVDTNGLHLTFGSLHAVPVPDSQSFKPNRPGAYFKKCTDAFPTREDLVNHFSVDTNDPDITAYQSMVIGLIWKHRERLTSTDSKNQLSLRHLIFSALEVSPATNSTVIFARLENCKASDVNEIIRIADESVEQMLPGRPDVYEVLAVSGDFPVHNILWKEFVRRVANGDTPKWFPLPGGAMFHDLKVGCIPAIKQLMEGAFVEELIAEGRGGLSAYYVENWPQIGNLRKNRRVNDGVLVASLIASIQTLRTEDSVLEQALAQVYDDRDSDVQKEITASGSVLKVTCAVDYKSYQNGKAIRSSMLRMASEFQNAALYLRCFILEMLIPVTGLQVVSRCGHTELYRKLYLSQSPFMMQTTKSNYQKATVQLLYMFAILPDYIIDDLYGGTSGAIVVNQGRNPFAWMPNDETLEIGVGTTKDLPIRKLEPLLESVSWVGELNRTADSLVSALQLKGREIPLEDSNEYIRRDNDGIILNYDKEHGVAGNASLYLEFLERRKQFHGENLRRQTLCNLLPETPVVVTDETCIHDLLNMRASGLLKQAILVSRMVPGYIERVWRKEDLAAMRLSKQPGRVSAWPRSGRVKSMAAAAVKASAPIAANSLKSPAELDGSKCFTSFSKQWQTRASQLISIIGTTNVPSSSPISATARTQFARLGQIAHLPSPLALCYREPTLCLKPGAGLECRQKKAVKSHFFRVLQQECTDALLRQGKNNIQFLVENARHPDNYDSFHIDVENVAHYGLQKTARSRIVGDVMLEQIEGQLRPLMFGQRSASLRGIFLHCDVAEWTVLQKGGTQAARDERAKSHSGKTISRQFDEEVQSASIPRRDKEGFTSGYLFYGAVAALRLNKEYERQANKCRPIEVYLMGGGFAVQEEAIGSNICDLAVSRCPVDSTAKVVIFRKDRAEPVIGAGEFSPDVRVVRRSCVLILSESTGLTVHDDEENDTLESLHGEAETRIIWAHENITKRKRGNEKKLSLVISNDSDCPAISLACYRNIRGQGLVHKVSNQFISMDELIETLETLGIVSEAVVAANGMGGNDFCPGTDGVRQTNYLKALVKNCSTLSGWKYVGQVVDDSTTQYRADTEAVLLTALAFIESYRAHIPVEVQTPDFIGRLDLMSHDESRASVEAWMVTLRQHIFRVSTLSSASKCLPETAHIILQGRRAGFVRHYWEGSYRSTWNREAIGCCESKWGFCLDSEGTCWPLYENFEVVKDLKKTIRFPFISCVCKACKNRTCSCKKKELVCLPGICKTCTGSCENDGSNASAANTFMEDAALCPISASVNEEDVDEEDASEANGAIYVEDSDDDSALEENFRDQFQLLEGSDSEHEVEMEHFHRGEENF